MEDTKNRQAGSDLRRHILERARHLLVRDGYHRLSMRRLARAIGYSATSIYLYFDNKDALFHALIDEGMEQLYAELREAAARHTGTPAARLEALCRSFISFGLGNPEYYEIMFMLHPERTERYPAEKYRRARRNLNLLVSTLEEGTAGGVFRVGDPRVSASAIWTSLHGLVSLLIAQRVDVRIDQEVLTETAIRQVLRGVTINEWAAVSSS